MWYNTTATCSDQTENQNETVDSCFAGASWLSSIRCSMSIVSQLDQPCSNYNFSYLCLFLAERSFTDPAYTCSIFVCNPLQFISLIKTDFVLVSFSVFFFRKGLYQGELKMVCHGFEKACWR